MTSTHHTLRREFSALNPFLGLDAGRLKHFVPIQSFPRRLPQLSVLYSVLFWLGSIVRYDPHSVRALQDSPEWIVVDGFLNQSRLWLVELFEMQLYKRQLALGSAR